MLGVFFSWYINADFANKMAIVLFHTWRETWIRRMLEIQSLPACLVMRPLSHASVPAWFPHSVTELERPIQLVLLHACNIILAEVLIFRIDWGENVLKQESGHLNLAIPILGSYCYTKVSLLNLCWNMRSISSKFGVLSSHLYRELTVSWMRMQTCSSNFWVFPIHQSDPAIC